MTGRPFQHPATVRVDRALAVHAIVHDEAQPEHWQTLDAWAAEAGVDAVVDAILEIVAMNQPTPERVAELEGAWWRLELLHPGGEGHPALVDPELEPDHEFELPRAARRHWS